MEVAELSNENPEPQTGCSYLAYGIIYVILLAVLPIGCLLIDPYYFDFPIGQEKAGLPADKAPKTRFATAITFAAEGNEPVRLVAGTSEVRLPIEVEVLQPDGSVAIRKQLFLKKSSSLFRRNDWADEFVPASQTGTYTLRVTQDSPGEAKIFLFQGPFFLRMFLMPFIAGFLVFLGVALKNSRSRRQKVIPAET